MFDHPTNDHTQLVINWSIIDTIVDEEATKVSPNMTQKQVWSTTTIWSPVSKIIESWRHFRHNSTKLSPAHPRTKHNNQCINNRQQREYLTLKLSYFISYNSARQNEDNHGQM